MKENEDPDSSYIVICIFNGLLCYTAITLNSVAIHALRKTSSLPKLLKTLLLSLAVSDLGVGLLVEPFHIAVNVMKLEQKAESDPTFNTIYIAHLITHNFFISSSLFGVIALGADRFLAIHFHLRYKELVTHKRVVAVVISIWIFSAFLSLIRLWIALNIIYSIFAIIEGFCLVVATCFYYKICVTVRRHTNHIRTLQVQQVAQSTEMENIAKLTKLSVGPLFVYLALLVCYLPNVCLLVFFVISGKTITTETMQLYTVTLIVLNSSLNPLIYCWKMRRIRHAVMNILRNIVRSHN